MVDAADFVHLHLHTEYSLLDGGNQVDKLVERVAELGMKAVAITDHGNIFGAVTLYAACKEKNIKPILGVEAYVTPPGKPRTDRTYSGGGEGGFHLVLLAMNNTGWQNLMYLCSEAFLTGFYYKPRIDREILEAHSQGLIAINGHLGSELGDHLLNFHRTNDKKHWELAQETIRWHARAFAQSPGDTIPRFYIELQHHIPEQNAINPLLIKLAKEHGIPLVCDNDAHFLRAEDHDTHDTLICISTGKGKNDPDRMHYPAELYVKSAAEMHELMEPYGADGKEALANTVRIADACNVTLALGENNSPLVRVRRRGTPEGNVSSWEGLPNCDDPSFRSDLTSWYKAYCEEFEVVPFAIPSGTSEAEKAALLATAKQECDNALRLLSIGGYRWRYATGLTSAPGTPTLTAVASPDEQSALQRNIERTARFERELKILADKGISAYFLIVWDFVAWGRQQGIPANARGSGVGTMIGYVLGLSNACPVEHGLLFERFTDPDRSEYPDIDIDLCQDGRGDVINYVRRKYGHVAQIITFGTLGAKAAIKDVGRVLEIPLGEVERLNKLVPAQLNITLQEALDTSADFKRAIESDSRFEQLMEHALALEGHTRHAGVHAAGVIVATRPLHEIVPLYKPSGGDETEIITQWDGPTCEKLGLLKMDFLGLRTLSIIERAKKLINDTLSDEEVWKAVGRGDDYVAVTRGDITSGPRTYHPLDLDRIRTDDPTVFGQFQRGDTTGIFQFESGGMRRLLADMKPDRLADLIAANALFRPGPMDLIPDYNQRKHGLQEVPKVHDIVERYTGETYGVMVYQEQVMQIVHGLGGIKLRDAYTLIKNISKKKFDKIDKERPKFVEGAQKQGLSKEKASELFELILKFAGYGFNKSHSTGYAIVAYQTAYLKTYFPNQYMSAFLTYESQANKVSDWIPYLEDCRKTWFVDANTGKQHKVGIEIRPPDINLSQPDFTVVFSPGEAHTAHTGHVRFGLRALKGVGDKAIAATIAARDKGGPFTSLYDFVDRVGHTVLNKTAMEGLIKSGALDSIHSREQRAAMLATIEPAMIASQKSAADKASGQSALFGGAAATSSKASGGTLARADAWNEADTLAKEKEALGFYVSAHPLDRWKSWFSAFTTHTTGTLKSCPQDTRVVLAAMVQSVRSIIIKNGRNAGQKMGILTIEDASGSAECVAFSDCFTKYGHLAAAENVLFVLGRVDLSRGDAQLMIDRLVPIEGLPLDGGRLRLFIDEQRLNGSAISTMEKVASLVRANVPAPTKPESKSKESTPTFPVDIVIGTTNHVAILAADPALKITLGPDLFKALTGHLGDGMVKIAGGVSLDKVEREKPKWGKKRRSGDDDE